MKQFLLIVAAVFVFNTIAFAQAPNFNYGSPSKNLTAGTSYTITPANSGGAVPATVYGQVNTFAGTAGNAGSTDGTGAAASFRFPEAIAADANGNLYIAEYDNKDVRKITPAGVVSTYAGNNGSGFPAIFAGPDGIAVDGSGNVFVSDYDSGSIIEITPTGTVSTFASGISGPAGLAFDQSGNLVVAAQDANSILKITPTGIVSIFAGNGVNGGYIDAPIATDARFTNPTDVKVDASGNIWVADYQNNVIRKITSAGMVTTLAGSAGNAGYANGTGAAALFNNPTGLAIGNGGIVYVADLLNNNIRAITPAGVVSLAAGSVTQATGTTDGTGTNALFNNPETIYIDGTGTGYIVDVVNNTIRKIILTGYTIDKPLPAGLSFDVTTGIISGAVSGAFAATSYTITAYNGSGYSSTILTLSSETAPNISYAPPTNNLSVGAAFSIIPTNSGGAVPATIYGQVTTVAGTGSAAYADDQGTAAAFNSPEGITADAAGNLYVADFYNNAIRKITSAGAVTTFAGGNGTGFAAPLNGPDGLAFDASGSLYIADYTDGKILKITSTGVVSTFYTAAAPFGPASMAFDDTGNLIVAAQDLNQILKITPAGAATPIAGNAGNSGFTDGTGTAAFFFNPTGVQVDASGNIIVADYLNNAVRKITPAGVVTTLAGNGPTTAGYANGTGTAALFNNTASIAMGSGSIAYIADFNNNDIRAVTPTGVVTLVAGSATQASGATDGIGTAALFNQPQTIYVDGNGNGYVGENANNTIRKIVLTGYSIDKTLPAGLTFDPATGTISGTPSATFPADQYTVTAYNTVGYSSTVITLSCTTKNDWLGNINTDWNTGANWSLGHVPTATETAQIGVVPYTGAAAQPNVGAATTANAIIFGTNNTPVLTVSSGNTLTVTTGLTVNLASTATINGPGTINISGTSLINNTASLTASLNAVIELGAAATLTNSGTFTLGSDVNGSSSIAALPLGATITGNVNVQRFIKGSSDVGDLSKRGYRLISSAVNTGIDGNGSHVSDLQYLLNSVYVSGAGAGANGFNVTTTQNPSIYLFREDVAPPPSNVTLFTTGYNWKGVAKINNIPAYNIGTQAKGTTSNINDATVTIPSGNGMLFFFRGDMTTSLTAPFTAPNDVTLTQTGNLNTGTIDVRLWFAADDGLGNNFSYTDPSTPGYNTSTSILTSGFTLVGNPYPSTINWEKFNQNGTNSSIYGGGGLSPTIYVFNALNKQYEAYIPILNGDTTSLNPGVASSGSSPASNMIASGQGFFIQASAAGQSLTFRETAKINAQPVANQVNKLMGMPKLSAALPKPLMRLKLSKDAVNTDEIVIRMADQANSNYSIGEDALDMGGNGALVSLSSYSADNDKLAINTLPMPAQQKQIIPLLVDATASGAYTLDMTQLDNMPTIYTVWLKDAMTGDSLNLRTTATYQFDIDKSNPASFGSSRFSITIGQSQVASLIDFTAAKVPVSPEVQVVWKTATPQNYTNFTVERSTDGGKTYQELTGVQATSSGTYNFLDKDPVTGQNLYRLKQVNVDNTVTYSKVVGIFYSDLSNNMLSKGLSIYPNPARSDINLAIAAPLGETATYNIKVINSSGMVVQNVTSSQATWQGNVSNLLPGSYIVRVFNNKDQTLIGRTKFEKL